MLVYGTVEWLDYISMETGTRQTLIIIHRQTGGWGHPNTNVCQ